MLLKDCNGCKYLSRLIGIGQGVRCTHPKNQNPESKDAIIIAYIKDCKYKTDSRR